MSEVTQEKINNLPVIKQFVFLLKKIKLPWLQGLSLYELLDLYIVGIIKGEISYRAAAIAFSFFMALFPFALFILNLIPYIPISGFQNDFLGFVQESVPPTTYDAIYKIINDIQDVLSEKIQLIEIGRYGFVILMILIATSLLFKFGVKREKNRTFISIGSVFTTILIIISSYFFGIWVVKFSKYNELYGSIGTLLIIMFYLWINCMVLLLGFDLNASIRYIKREKQKELDTL